MKQNNGLRKLGLYDPQFEHDACGIAMLANIQGKKSHQIVDQALTALERLDHRGGRGADDRLGDGAGILTEIPHSFFEKEWQKKGKDLPPIRQYGVGMLFLPRQTEVRQYCEELIENVLEKEQIPLFGWRTVPTNPQQLNDEAKATQPIIRQLFVLKPSEEIPELTFEQKMYQVRRKVEKQFQTIDFQGKEKGYFASFSAKTIVYKGLLLPEQLRSFYLDLTNEQYKSAFALVHNRFSTNTFPSWNRAQPNRFVMHNGEINTINGNIHWNFAREKSFESNSSLDIQELCPIINVEGSDSAIFDNVLESLVLSGWSLPHAMMMMIPEPWQKNQLMDEDKKAFYQYHSCLMEPWDGPAAMSFTDGDQIGACLDRNGLRPARFIVTDDDFICLSSEVGVVDVPEEKIIMKDRLKPGQMILVDIREGRLCLDEEIKQEIVSKEPYRQWVREQIVPIENVKILNTEKSELKENNSMLERLRVNFGYTVEEWEKGLKPMILQGKEPIGSMGYDAPLAVLSDRPQLLFHYFKQRFAQVTNPPIDAIREELVTSVEVLIGTEGNLLHPNEQEYKKIRLQTPVLSEKEIERLRFLQTEDFKSVVLPFVFPINEQQMNMEQSLEAYLQSVDEAVEKGSNILILSDRGVNAEHAAIPSLLAVSAVHHHLIQTGARSKVSLVIESGEVREIHHFATLLGYGANAIYPYLVYASLSEMMETEGNPISVEEASCHYVKSVTKGILKIMSKMGISTVQSYIGAQIFEAIGIHSDVIQTYFPRTASQIGGLTMADIEKEVRMRHSEAFDTNMPMDTGSDYQWRHGGEPHLFNPETIHTLQHAVRTGRYDLYKKYSRMLQDEMNNRSTLRGLLEFDAKRKPISIDEVEPVESIFKRFKTGAMSYGSISEEAHVALAIAMNRIGGKSNSGEGGEKEERFSPLKNGDSLNSRIKQVASGRFGVTSHYLVHCDEIQIKMAQGAKPGEGGQLAGHKVTSSIAKTRGSTPGIELISPPPHHDIYSIEDLAQLIFDLKNANEKARINVKLVSEAGVGTIAAGVAKAKADVILISGYDGGTGAASKTSIKHTGVPWELGLAEAHQTLVLNGLRNQVTLETDGKLMTGRDVVIAALLGAEEFGFSTLPLVALGCVMMRVCHLDTCPVGIATQNPELRKKMMGTAEHIVHLMHFIAEEMREWMAELGFRTVEEMVGQSNVLKKSTKGNWKAQKLDFSPLLFQQDVPRKWNSVEVEEDVQSTLDVQKLIPMAKLTLEDHERLHVRSYIANTDRSVGTRLGSEISKRFGREGLPDHTIRIDFRGIAGQSFAAFIPNGLTMTLEGEANDYVGKGLSGGKVIMFPPTKSTIPAEKNIIMGNAAFYGATSGEAFINGKAGERFCVRNSGANVVVEGVGDHGCEYMTGGRVVILGEVGKNFAAGMSGGIAYVFPPDEMEFRSLCNPEHVDIEQLEDPGEIEFVKKIVDQHWKYTESYVAAQIIQNWGKNVSQFIRVIPKEFKKKLVSDRFRKDQLIFKS
ncbi:glutamate synthase domain-containing protein 2/glutamate synthase domain-containing protein 1/glutamate synthase domain-containing protein 3 [Oikeobacillus pervagus]|uniref:Glutamate synthase domain-containing protein 2/glutamate synthase domain-containing protein 1/glutamate synthase domain-containing protein 3 n=1 Tax=Oikeobacillus pervagus TaxID=1325931 RepID=A0AAJ1WJX8_9BACI|nr:glutamate synthase large subunit [Oikeobacillus pervagus]MDQ0216120.1 glutamate synthase domain-containing protein 2/glutamate synthase domain-containing protein 1/glutamate synthase domain-containing protein 3 [Oikeobacillus pervagus]